MKKIPVTDRDVARAIIGIKISGANTRVIEAGINYLLRRFSVCRQMQKTGQDLHHHKPIQSIVREILSIQRDDKETIAKLVSQSHNIASCSEAKHKELHNTGKLSDKTE